MDTSDPVPCIKHVGILGTGTIGTSWAAFYASRGMHVMMYDHDRDCLAQAFTKSQQIIRCMGESNLLTSVSEKEAINYLSKTESLECVVKESEWIQESIIETIEIKLDFYTELSKYASPELYFASSTSGHAMSNLQPALRYPERSFVAHPFSPPHLLPLVELVAGNRTAPGVIPQAYKLYEQWGKVPVVLKKEVPGHIANRLAGALWREAVNLVLSGVASVEDVDKALYAGPGLRWAFMGQHLIYHLAGGEKGYSHFFDHLGPEVEKWLADLAQWTTIPENAESELVDGIQTMLKGKTVSELEPWRNEKLTRLIQVISNPTESETVV